MPWLQLTFTSTEHNAEQFSELLAQHGAASVTLRDAADQALFEPAVGETPLWQQMEVIGLFDASVEIENIVKQISDAIRPQPLPGWKVQPLEDKDWQREWMQHFQPMRFGDKLWIIPSWHEPPDLNAANILLDPGLAFGTGTHATTSLCLQWLDQNICGGETLIDFGCGSGVLALAAVKLGAQRVWAVDNDPQALISTQSNAKKNRVDEKLTICQPEQLKSGPVDIIIANILANPLISLAEILASKIKKDGYIVLSGILTEQAAMVSKHYSQWFNMEKATYQEDWARLQGLKK